MIGAWKVAAELEALTGSSVTDAEAEECYRWLLEWARDCSWGDVDADGLEEFEPLELVRRAVRHVDGGARFVLEDVRRMACSSSPRMRLEPAGAGDEHEAMRAAVARIERARDALEARLVDDGRSPEQASNVAGALVAGGRCPTCGLDVSLASRVCKAPERAARFVGGCPLELNRGEVTA